MNATRKIADTDVDISTPEKYILSINLRIDGLSFLIQNQEKKALHMENFAWLNVKDWTKSLSNLTALIQNHSILKHNYPKVFVFVASPNSFLIPEALFMESRIERIYSSYLGITNHELHFSSIDIADKGAYLIFGIAKEIAQLLNTKWNVNWQHSSKYFLQDQRSLSIDGQHIHLLFSNGIFEVVAMQDKQLIAHNYFEFASAEELMFNLIGFTQQIGFEVEQVTTFVEGEILKSSKLYKLIEKYFPKLRFNQSETPTKESAFKKLIEAANYENR